MTQIISLALVAAMAACGARSDSGSAAAPWRTVFDSTGDTIVARTTGDVAEGFERRLVLEQRIGEAEGSDTVTFGRIQYLAVTSDDRIFAFDEQGRHSNSSTRLESCFGSSAAKVQALASLSRSVGWARCLTEALRFGTRVIRSSTCMTQPAIS